MSDAINMQYAPIVLFVYKRLWHTQQTVSALQKNDLAKYSTLYIYSDNAKNKENENEVNSVREWLAEITGFQQVHVIKRETNFGLAKSIIDGVTTILSEFNKVIVVEDDLIVSPYFLKYMNDGLNLYEQHSQVASISGYAYPLPKVMPESYFIRGADCWGWATWKRAWGKFEPDGRKLLSILKQEKRLKQFDYDGTQRYTQMLKDQIKSKNNSWAIRWYASAFVNNMLTLYPGQSLVKNIGMDNSGEHCVASTIFDGDIDQNPINLKPIPIEHDQIAFVTCVNFFKSLREPLIKKIIRRIKKFLNGCKAKYLKFMISKLS